MRKFRRIIEKICNVCTLLSEGGVVTMGGDKTDLNSKLFIYFPIRIIPETVEYPRDIEIPSLSLALKSIGNL